MLSKVGVQQNVKKEWVGSNLLHTMWLLFQVQQGNTFLIEFKSWPGECFTELFLVYIIGECTNGFKAS